MEEMKLYSGETYWDKRDSAYESHPKLNGNISTEVLIVGGGMSGNLAAYELAKRGHKVVLVEQKSIASGSSKANTGMLQYSSDKMLTEFADSIGERKALLFYKMCLEAMKDLTKLSESMENQDNYIERNSIYYASTIEDVESIKNEYKVLKKNKFPVDFLDREDLKKEYGIDKGGAIKTWYDAEVNPYKFIQVLVQKNKKMGVIYYEDTSIDLDHIGRDSVETLAGYKIDFQKIILATGYTKLYDCIKDKARIERTYALSAVIKSSEAWKEKAMVWETRRPYLYFRTAPDNRLIAGGEDEKISFVEEDKKEIFKKTEKIKNQIEEIYPHLKLEVEYRWNALFGTSKDGLPFIGIDPKKENIYYLLGYEGNGTCYSMAGSKILADLIEKKENIYSEIVKIDR